MPSDLAKLSYDSQQQFEEYQKFIAANPDKAGDAAIAIYVSYLELQGKYDQLMKQKNITA
jgi:hypothetical protein